MARWYSDKVRDNIDVSQAIRDAGKMGEAIAYAAQGVKNYADTIHAKKREKIADKQKADTNSTKRYVADKGYKGKVESASITARAKDRATAAMLKAHKIDFDKERYKSDKAYRKTIDGKILDIKKQKIANAGKIGAAKISAGATLGAAKMRSGATRYKADKDIEKTKLSGKTQLEVANINASAKTNRAKKKATKTRVAQLNLSEDMPDEEILKKIGKPAKGIDNYTIEF